MNNGSILHPRIGGLVYVTGLHGVGKTTFATTAEAPDLTGIIDLDLKFDEIAKEVGYAWYRGPYEVPKSPFGYDVDGLAAWFAETIKAVPEGLTTLVIDNATEIEAALGAIVAKDPARYGVNPSNAAAGRYGGVNPGINKLWGSILSFLKGRGIKLILVTAHMSQPWVNGAPLPNKFRGKGNKALQQYSNLSLVMVSGDQPPVPSGVVLKEQLARRTFNAETGQYEVVRTIPLRLPCCDWPSIRDYLDNPPDFRRPKPGELPTKDELHTYGDFMSAEHLDFIRVIVNAKWEDEGTEGEGEQPGAPRSMAWEAFVEFVGKQGWNLEEAKKLLSERFGKGYKPERATEYIGHLRSFYSAMGAQS